MQSLQELQKRAEELDHEVQQLETRLKSIRFERDAVRRSIIHHHAQRPYMQCGVPRDILAEIFRVYVKELEESPWVLTQVCYLWRDVAFDLSILWSSLWLHNSPNPIRFTRGMQVCANGNDLREALSRAKDASLDINCHFVPPIVPDRLIGTKPKEPKSFRRMFELLGGEVTSRWRSITIGDSLKELKWADYFGHPDARLANLESLDISFECRPLISLASLTSMNLRVITVPLEAIFDWPTSGPSQYFPSVKRLTLTPTFRHISLNWETIDEHRRRVLGRFPSLEMLDIAVPEIMPEDVIVQASAAREIFALRLTDSHRNRTWDPFLSSFPLRRLCICYHNSLRQVEPGSLYLPHLTDLIIQGTSTLPQLIAFNAPKLEKLEICHASSKGGTVDLARVKHHFTSNTGPENTRLDPKVLYINSTYMSIDSIRQLLTFFPSIVELYLNQKLESSFYRIWREELPISEAGKQAFLCPRLKLLSVEFSNFTGSDTEAEDEMIEKANLTRYEAGCSIIHLNRKITGMTMSYLW